MKCIPLTWPNDPTPRPTFVLDKREMEVFADIPSTNPRSHWIAASFGGRRLYACDGCRFVCCGPLEDVAGGDAHYIPYLAVKNAAKSSKMTTAILISHSDTGYQVAAYETGRKEWALHEGDVLDEGALVIEEVPRVDVGPAIPSVEIMDGFLAEAYVMRAKKEPASPVVTLKPEYLATFGKLAAVAKGVTVAMHAGSGPLDPVFFSLEDVGEDCWWRYVLMPTRIVPDDPV